MLAFGDSITAGVVSDPITFVLIPLLPEQSYPHKLQAKLASRYTTQTITVVNEGKPGERADQAVNRFIDALRQHQPEVALVMEGSNDVNGSGFDAIPSGMAALEQMIKEARARGVAVMMATIPLQRAGAQRAFGEPYVRDYNKALRRMVLEEGAVLVDVEALGLSILGQDGLHPTEMGYGTIASLFADAIMAQYEKPATGR